VGSQGGTGHDPCADCVRGPVGVAGHDRLFSHTMNMTQMQFKCRECGAIWVRRYGDERNFIWGRPAGEHPGMDVPGRPGTAPP